MLIKETVLSAINSNQPIFIEKYETDMDKLINWENVHRQFRISLEKPNEGMLHNPYDTKGNVHFIDKNNFYLNHIHLIESKVRHLVKKIQSVHPKRYISTAMMVATLKDSLEVNGYKEIQGLMFDNYTNVSPYADKAYHESNLHHDETDNLYLQCYGEVTWMINDVKYKLTPGDAIFVPARTKHIVYIDGAPRLALIMNFLNDRV